MDAQQDVTLGEIYRSVQRIERDVQTISDQGQNTRELMAGYRVELDRHDHDIRNLKQNQLVKTRLLATSDSISVKALIAIIASVSAGIAAIVAAYIK